jgi:hypothetical protein
MKIIEAMKKLKANEEKIGDLQNKISAACAHLSFETPLYDDPKAKVREWIKACCDLTQDSVDLLVRIQKTNLTTFVDITLGDEVVTKTISEWVWRRRKFAAVDLGTWTRLNDRGLKEGNLPSTTGVQQEVKIVRNFDPELRDKWVAIYRDEPHKIDAALEVVNAVTELVP